MKILYLMSSFPYPAYGGGALRIMGLLNGAASAGHDLSILSFGKEPPTDTPVHDIASHIQVIPAPHRRKQDRLKTLLLSRQADMQRRSWDTAYVQALTELLTQQSFDIVQLQSLEMGIYWETIRTVQPTAKIIYDAYNAEAELQKMVFQTDRQHLKRLPIAVYSWMQWQRLIRFEMALCQAVDGVLTVSQDDHDILQSGAGDTPIWVVNNGITVQDYATEPLSNVEIHQPALVFTGIMDYRPNVDAALWFVEDILPHVKHKDVRVYLVGNRPSASVQALANHPQVTVTGFVDDVLPYLHQATIFVVPLRVGSGTRLKLLQAMSAQRPIISTSVGAMGLNIKAGRDMLIADNAVAFAASINTLLNQPDQRQQLAKNGRSFVETHFDWSVISPRLLAAYDATNQA